MVIRCSLTCSLYATRMPIRCLLIFSLVLLLASCSRKVVEFPPYEEATIPAKPDYTSLAFWAAHPQKDDPSDLLPGKGQFSKEDPLPEVDVFFVHPTIYTKKHNPDWPWQGDVTDAALNERTDQSTIKYQASAFNGSANVYAPRYRQAHLDIFRAQDTVLFRTTLQLAYDDVREAFQYYLNQYNNGRPFILASHSQGTLHAARLLKEFIDGKPLQHQLVAAYLVGYTIKTSAFKHVKPCEQADEIGCWISWNTYQKNYYPPRHQEVYAAALSTNPLNWTIDETYAPASRNEASILRNYKKVYVNLCDAVNHQGLLWITKPSFFGSAFYRSKRYHIADYNLFYGNIRTNVKVRISAFFRLQTNAPSFRD
jgi:hypothetical protein